MVQAVQLVPPTTLFLLIKLTEPDLTAEDLAVEVDYLKQDLRDLEGMRQARMRSLYDTQGPERQPVGVRFEVPADRLRAVLQRLCHRLDDTPLDTLVLIQIDQIKLQIQTRDAEELASIMAAAEALLPPERIFLAKAETYARTRGEFSPAELANLDWLRQHLDLSQDDADWLRAKAMGPFQTLMEKQQYYQEVLTDELSREYPLGEETHAVLQELASNLGLPKQMASEIYRQHVGQIQIKVEAARQQQQQEQEQLRQQQQAQTAQEQAQQQQQERSQQIESYRAEFRQAIATSLYPREFDQGRLEQARRLWHLAPDEVAQIEARVRDDLYGAIDSALNIDYNRLRQLLWAQDWQAADAETERVILAAISRDMQPLDRDGLMQLPCLDLGTLDQLWSRYSQDQFGFKAQHEVYLSVQRRPLDFFKAVEWQGSVSLGNVPLVTVAKPYNELQFALTAPRGHLPSWRWCCQTLESGYQVGEAIIEAMFLHYERCFSLNSPPLSTLNMNLDSP